MVNKARAPTLPDVTSRRLHTRYLDVASVWKLALSISKRLGIIIYDPQRLLKRLKRGLVTIHQGRDYILWVDRQYIAVAPYWSDQVTYLYVTRRHIREEAKCNRAVFRAQGHPVLDAFVCRQFASARQAMDRSWKDCALRQSMLDDGEEGELDLEAPWT